MLSYSTLGKDDFIPIIARFNAFLGAAADFSDLRIILVNFHKKL